MKLKWTRKLSVIRGPFKFFYTAAYQAEEGDEFWELVLFKDDGYESIGPYPPAQKIELIQIFGRRAARAAHEEAEKPMRVKTAVTSS